VQEAAPARRFALYGAALELAAGDRMEGRLALVGEAYTTGEARRLRGWSRSLTAAGLIANNRSRLGYSMT
jgi:hypothetical protein